MCRSSEGIAADPDGPLAQNYNAANDEVANGNLTGQHIPWWIPTRQVKSFHPRSPGMAAYRDSIIEAISVIQMAGTSTSGDCVFNITESMTCADDADNLYAIVDLWAPDGSVIYAEDDPDRPLGLQINDKDALNITSSYGTLIIVGEHEHDYIQFTSGKNSWTSGTTSGPATCSMLGHNWDPNGPTRSDANSGMWLTRMFECHYPCSKSD